MSLTLRAVGKVVAQLSETLSLREQPGEDGPLMKLTSESMPDFHGNLRMFVREGEDAERLVTTSLYMPSRGLETHMAFCLGAAASSAPHFIFQAADRGADSYSFHLDLIPRHELGSNVAYMREVYAPLTETFVAFRDDPELVHVTLGPEQHALLSPWTLVKTGPVQAFDRVATRAVLAYRERFVWLCLHPPESAGPPDADRDRRFRLALFDPSVDPVWARVSRLVGEARATRMRELLSGDSEL